MPPPFVFRLYRGTVRHARARAPTGNAVYKECIYNRKRGLIRTIWE